MHICFLAAVWMPSRNIVSECHDPHVTLSKNEKSE